MAFPDGWFAGEALIKMERTGSGAAVDITADVSNFRSKPGERNTESEPVFGGGRVNVRMSRADHEVSFDFITTDVLMLQRALGGSDATQPLRVEFNADPENQRITILFEDGDAQLHYVFADATGVSVEEDVAGDSYLKGTMSFKIPPADKDGNNTSYAESTPNKNDNPLPALVPAEGSY